MAESPVKHKPTSRVIDLLHSQIDELKTELELCKVSQSEHKKKAAVLALKNELLVDQLANCKHENDMINAVLKRKERRIVDLEEQYNELCSLNDTLKLLTKNLKIRCENLQELTASLTAEYERLKIAYDAMVAAQTEYKRHYQDEIRKLGVQLETYKTQSQKELAELAEKLQSNDKDVDTMIESLTNKRKVMDNMYVNRNKMMLDMLAALARAAKLHGEESKVVLDENLETIRLLREKYPDLADRIAEHEPTVVDLDTLVIGATSTDTPTPLSDIEPTVDEPRNTHRNLTARRRRNKRASMQFLPEPTSLPHDHGSETLPRARPDNWSASSSRSSSGESNSSHSTSALGLRNGLGLRNSIGPRGSQNSRQASTSSQVSQSGRNNRNRGGHAGTELTRNSSRGLTQGKNNKRRMFSGGSSEFNSNTHDRKIKAEI